MAERFFPMHAPDYFLSGAYRSIKSNEALLLYLHFLFLLYMTEDGFISNDYDDHQGGNGFPIRGLNEDTWNEVVVRFVHHKSRPIMTSPSIYKRFDSSLKSRFSGMKKGKTGKIQKAIEGQLDALYERIILTRSECLMPTLNAYPFRGPFLRTLKANSIITAAAVPTNGSASVRKGPANLDVNAGEKSDQGSQSDPRDTGPDQGRTLAPTGSAPPKPGQVGESWWKEKYNPAAAIAALDKARHAEKLDRFEAEKIFVRAWPRVLTGEERANLKAWFNGMDPDQIPGILETLEGTISGWSDTEKEFSSIEFYRP